MNEQLKQAERALDRMSGYMPRIYKDDIEIVRRALTTSQPAQAGEQWTETAAALNYYAHNGQWPTQPAAQATPDPSRRFTSDIESPTVQAALSAKFGATPAQQAAGEPVGGGALIVAEILSLADEYAEAEAKAGGLTGCGGDVGQQHELDEDAAYIKGRLTDAVGKLAAIATHPAPGVPEGFALVPMTEDQVWHNDSIMSANAIGGLKMDAVMRIVRGVEAHHSERLAAAQAKGGA